MTDKTVADAAKAEAKAAVKVRVVAMGGDWPINAVVKLAKAEAKAAVAGGWADDDPDAVAYAESLAEEA